MLVDSWNWSGVCSSGGYASIDMLGKTHVASIHRELKVDRIGVSFCPASASTTTTIMPHQALRIDEILREVAARVVDTHPSTAVSLACCAKSFEEPALRALWETQKELPTFIQALPPNCWEIQPQVRPGTKPEIVCGSPQLRTSSADSMTVCVDAHTNPIER